MDTELYKALLEKPLAMHVPGLTQAQDAQQEINNAIDALGGLNNTLPSGEIVNLDKIEKAQSQLNAAMTQIHSATAQMQYVADNAIWLSSKANLVSSLDHAIGLPVSSCFNANTVFDVISGSLDTFFSEGMRVAHALSNKVKECISGSLSWEELEKIINTAIDKINKVKVAINEKVESCKRALKEFEDKIMNSSIATTLRGIYNNPCTKAVLDSTLPPDIKAVLNR